MNDEQNFKLKKILFLTIHSIFFHLQYFFLIISPKPILNLAETHRKTITYAYTILVAQYFLLNNNEDLYNILNSLTTNETLVVAGNAFIASY